MLDNYVFSLVYFNIEFGYLIASYLGRGIEGLIADIDQQTAAILGEDYSLSDQERDIIEENAEAIKASVWRYAEGNYEDHWNQHSVTLDLQPPLSYTEDLLLMTRVEVGDGHV